MTMKKRALALMLAVLMAASSTGAATAAVESSVAAHSQSVSLQAEAGTVTGTVRTAPTKANLESQGPLGWIHFNNKVLEDCAQMGEGNRYDVFRGPGADCRRHPHEFRIYRRGCTEFEGAGGLREEPVVFLPRAGQHGAPVSAHVHRVVGVRGDDDRLHQRRGGL